MNLVLEATASIIEFLLPITRTASIVRQSSMNMVTLLWLGKAWLVAIGLGWLSLFLHRALFSYLSKLPGPWYTLFTDIFLMYKEFTAQRRLYIHELHKSFGSVVRLGPNEVSFTSLEALREIYQSGGSGYDKTEFYNLFKQYGMR